MFADGYGSSAVKIESGFCTRAELGATGEIVKFIAKLDPDELFKQRIAWDTSSMIC